MTEMVYEARRDLGGLRVKATLDCPQERRDVFALEITVSFESLDNVAREVQPVPSATLLIGRDQKTAMVKSNPFHFGYNTEGLFITSLPIQYNYFFPLTGSTVDHISESMKDQDTVNFGLRIIAYLLDSSGTISQKSKIVYIENLAIDVPADIWLTWTKRWNRDKDPSENNSKRIYDLEQEIIKLREKFRELEDRENRR